MGGGSIRVTILAINTKKSVEWVDGWVNGFKDCLKKSKTACIFIQKLNQELTFLVYVVQSKSVCSYTLNIYRQSSKPLQTFYIRLL